MSGEHVAPFAWTGKIVVVVVVLRWLCKHQGGLIKDDTESSLDAVADRIAKMVRSLEGAFCSKEVAEGQDGGVLAQSCECSAKSDSAPVNQRERRSTVLPPV